VVELLVPLTAAAAFLDSVAFAFHKAHRVITPTQLSVIVLTNLCWLFTVAFVVRRAIQNLRAKRVSAVGIRAALRSTLMALFPVLAFVAAKLPYYDLVPRWDAGTYFNAILEAAGRFTLAPTSLATEFRLAGHPTHAYAMYLTMGQLLRPSNHYVMNTQNLLLACVGIYCFGRVCRRLFPNLTPIQHALITLAFAFNPLYFGASMHTNADLPVAVFLLVVLAAFLSNRLVLFSFGGLCLCFSKEPGTLAYALLLFLLFALYAFPRVQTPSQLLFDLDELLEFPRRRLEPLSRGPKSIFRSAAVMLAASIPLLVFYVYHKSLPQERWASSTSIWNDDGFLCFGLRTMVFKTVLIEGLVMNFAWIPTLSIVAYFAWQQFTRRTTRVATDGTSAVLRAMLGLLVVYLLVHCLYINFLNPRYVLGFTPLLILLGAAAFHRLVQRRMIQIGSIATFLGLSVWQTWRAVDPISNALWGTFDIGSHPVLHVNGDTPGDLQGKADGMVYNAQFAAIERLYRNVNRWVFAQPKIPVVLMGTSHYWLLYYNLGTLRVTAKSHELTTSQKGSLGISMITLDAVNPSAPYDPAVYVALPWVEDVGTSLAKLSRVYRIKNVHRIHDGGYFVDVYELEKLVPAV
jgi:hypothetical protein